MNNVTTINDFQIQTIVNGGWRENCYLVRRSTSDDLLVIDPGSDAEKIIAAIETQNATPTHILLTHAHHDHVGAAAELSQRYHLPVNLHRDDVRLLRHAPMYALRFEGKHIKTPEWQQTFDKNPAFSVGDRAVKIYHTPGHTRGSVCIAIDNFVFTGDTLMHRHLGRTDLPGADAAVLNSSVNHLCELLPGETVIFPGHGPAWRIADAREWLAKQPAETQYVNDSLQF